MARYRESVCKICRLEKTKLFLKGERCLSPKCAFERRKPPEFRMKSRRFKSSEYGMQLREKQRAKRMAGILERQFRYYFRKAAKSRGLTGEALLQALECRLDNIVLRLGFTPSRMQARQMISHRKVMVNGRVVDIPSYRVRVGERISLVEKAKNARSMKESLEKRKGTGLAPFLGFDEATLTGTLLNVPTREQISFPVQERLIVELYSK